MEIKYFPKLVDQDRLSKTFCDLVRIDSPSRQEKEVVFYLKELFEKEFNAETIIDDSSKETGSNTGNLIVKIKGNVDKEPLFFNAHLDTVEPCRGINVVFENGVFKSDGRTILGGDDKAAVAILIEALRILKDRDIEFGPIEFLFTVCEEIGLLGAKAFNPSLLDAKAGYALDSTDPDMVIHKAPCATRFKLRIIGRAAHSGLNPEEGINAIKLVSEAIAGLSLGRIDEETTCNIGIIKGGKATNIVPDIVELEGEVRSHNKDKLKEVQDEIISSFYKTIRQYKEKSGDISAKLPRVETEVFDDYPLMDVKEDDPLIKTVFKAASKQDRNLFLKATGGGSDANVFNGKGLRAIILGIGMQKVHTTEEFIRLDDMVKTVALVLGIIKLWPCTDNQ